MQKKKLNSIFLKNLHLKNYIFIGLILLLGLFLLPIFPTSNSSQTEPVHADSYEFIYRLNDDGETYTVTGYTGTPVDIKIPAIYNLKVITAIGRYAFQGCTTLRSVDFTTFLNSHGISSIGEGAFDDCTNLISFNSDKLNNLKEIGIGAFGRCSSLTSIEFRNGLKTIGSYAFNNCSSLTSIYLPSSVISIGTYAFYSCTSLTSIDIHNVENIGSSAFRQCTSLASVIISKYVTSIEASVFSECSNLSSVTFEEGSLLTSIGGSAFWNCTSLTSITIPENVTSIGYYAFYSCSNLTEIIIPKNVTSIGDSAFMDCSNLKTMFMQSTTPPTLYNTSSISSATTKIYVPHGSLNAYKTAAVWSNSSLVNKIVSDAEYYGFIFNLNSDNLSYNVEGYYPFAQTNIEIPSRYNGLPVTIILDNAFSSFTRLNEITIPNSVTSIGNSAFFNCSNLTAVTISNSVTSIGDEAFWGCLNLTTVTIPNSVTSIGEATFAYCSRLTSITIPSSLTSIGPRTFSNCSNLNKINTNSISKATGKTNGLYVINNSGTPVIIDGIAIVIVSENGNNHTLNFVCETVTNLTIPNSVTSIGASAFLSNYDLASITIPNSVTSIGDSAFANCSNLKTMFMQSTTPPTLGHIEAISTATTKIYVPNESVNTYKTAPVWSNSRISYKIASDAELYLTFSLNEERTAYSVIGKDGSLSEIEIPSVYNGLPVTTISDSAFSTFSNLTEIIIPSSVTSIGSGAFYGCSSLTSIIIPDGVKTIQYVAFYNCSSLNSITFAEGSKLTSIGDSAFMDCSSLTEITIPSSVTSIGDWAFDACTNLTEITIPNSVTSIGQSAFQDCSSLTSITIPASVTSIGWSAFWGCSNLSSVIFEEQSQLPSIENSAFFGCLSLISITIPNGLASIEDSAFYYCSSLEEIIIPSSVTNIGESAFWGCLSLTEIIIPSGVTIIKDETFYACSNLNSILFAEGSELTSIGEYAFYDCLSLNSITIPKNVNDIGKRAFYGCSNLTAVTIPNSVTSIGQSAFYDCSKLTTMFMESAVPPTLTSVDAISSATTKIFVPQGSVEIYRSTYNWSAHADKIFSLIVTVIFQDWEGTQLSQQTITNGQGVSIPANPSREGNAKYSYSFIGWDKPIPPQILEDITFTATYSETINSYNVTFQDHDGSILQTQSVEYESSAYTPSEPTRIGYTFANWDKSFENITEDIIITALYTINQYTISFDPNNDSVIASITQNFGTEAFAPITPTKTGYTFAGWFRDNVSFQNEYEFPITMPAENITLYAKWTANVYAVNYVTNGGIEISQEEYTYDILYTLKDTTKTGYTFEGWYDNADFTGEIFTEIPANNGSDTNKTFYAKWSANEYTIAFNYQGAENGNSTENKEVIFDSVYGELPQPTKTGYTFGGWFTEQINGTQLNPGTIVKIANNHTLYAHWIINQYEIYFNSNGGSWVSPIYKDFNTNLTKPTDPTKTGYSFDGWYHDEDLTQACDFDTYKMPAENITLYAKWTTVTYIIDYILNGGIETVNVTEYNIESDAINLAEPNRVGYSFVGWRGTGIEGNATKNITIPTGSFGDRLYTAVWIKTEGEDLYPIISWGMFDYEIIRTENDGADVFIRITNINASFTEKSYIIDSIYVENSINYHVEEIGNGFNTLDSNAENIFLTEGIKKVNSWAFSNSNLISIALSDTIISIGNYAFNSCSNLEFIDFEQNSQLEIIGEGCFQNCLKLNSVIIPDQLISIGNNSFESCINLKSVIFGSNSLLETIGNNAFKNCSSLISINIPANVNSIGNNSFESCINLTLVIFEEESQLLNIGESAFKDCSSLNSITLPNKVTIIGNSAFQYCYLTSITIPENVTSIGNYAFSGCSKLNSVVFAEESQLITIGNSAFSNSALTSITIPNSITSIGTSVFENCSNLNSVIFAEGTQLTNIGIGAFRWCSSLTLITIPVNVTNLEKETFYGCSNLPSINSSNVTTIGDSAFYGCSSLTSINIEKVTTIGDRAFENCLKLISITIPSPVTSIGSYAFSNCLNLSTVVFGKNSLLETIKDYTFYLCSNLRTITIPESVTGLENGAFYGCSSLISITIPDGVTSIGDGAFMFCTSLTSLTISEGVESIGSQAFQYCSKLTSVIIPSSVTSIGSGAFRYCYNLTSITISENVTSIENYTFGGCSSLTSIIIPSSVTTLSNNAFADCSSLTSIEVEETNNNYSSVEGVVFNKDQTILLIYPAGKEDERYTIPSSVESIDYYAFKNYKLKYILIFNPPVFDPLTLLSSDIFYHSIKFLVNNDKVYTYKNDINWISYSDRIFPWHVTVRFFDEDDNENPISTQTIDYDTEANPPYDEAYRPGYNTTWDKKVTNIVEDVNINAIYTPITYYVSFFRNNPEAWGNAETQYFFYEEFKSLLPNSFISEGYIFESWNTKPDGSGETYQNMQEVGNLTDHFEEIPLYAQWKRNEYTVTFEFRLERNEVIYSSSQKVEYHGSAIDPREFDPEANKIGYFLILRDTWLDNVTSDRTITGDYYPIGYWVELNYNTFEEDSNWIDRDYFTYDKSKNLASFYGTRTGYTFKNWNTKRDGSGTTYQNGAEVSNLTTEDGETVILYAQWEINKYKIDFEIVFKGEIIHSSSQIVEHGQDAIDPRDELGMNQEGYIFRWDSELKDIQIDKTINGIYTPITYTVIYNFNNNTSSYYNRIEEPFTYDGWQVLRDGQSTFYVEGYDFLSWNTKRDGSGIDYPSCYEGNLTTKNNEIINLYAQWNHHEYTVNFEIVFKEETILSSSQTVKYGKNAIPPRRSDYIDYFVGYNFGWDKYYFNITSDLTISLVYIPINYKVCFYEPKGSQQINYGIYTFTYDEPTQLPPSPNKPGYKFKGWITEDNYVFPANSTISVNFTTIENETIYLKASWEPIKYVVSYDANSGSDPFTGSMNKQNFTFDESQTLLTNTFHREGYIFNGWYDRSDWTKYEDGAMVKNLTIVNNETVTLYANWKPINYTVVFDANTGIGSMESQSFTYNITKALKANSFVKTGYYFYEWNTKRDGSGKSYQNSELIYKLTTISDGEISLYAQWLPCEYIIDFELNYPVDTSLDTIKIKLGEILPKLPIPERSGYIFKGWYTEEGQVITSGDEYVFDKNITLIANWNKAVAPFNFLIIYIVGGVATIIAVGITIPIVLRKKRIKRLSIGKKK